MRSWNGLLITGVAVSLGFSPLVNPAFGQSFDDRWSVIPKANAEPSAISNQIEPSVSGPMRNAGTSGQVESNPPVPRAKPNSRSAGSNALRAFSGAASFYSYTGGKTASGGAYRRDALTAAHRTLAFGTRVRVTDVKTKKSVDVIVTDRGPAIRNRVLDLSLGAAQALGIAGRGVVQVRGEVIGAEPPVLGKGP